MRQCVIAGYAHDGSVMLTKESVASRVKPQTHDLRGDQTFCGGVELFGVGVRIVCA